MHELIAGPVRPMLLTLLAAVGVVVLIACANVANLLLVRASVREREMAIRLSIGAGRVRLVRQLLAERLLLAIAGGVAGITFAVWVREGLLNLLVNASTPIDLNTGIDWRVLGFALLVSAATGLLCGVLPAVRSTRLTAPTAWVEPRPRGLSSTSQPCGGWVTGRLPTPPQPCSAIPPTRPAAG